MVHFIVQEKSALAERLVRWNRSTSVFWLMSRLRGRPIQSIGSPSWGPSWHWRYSPMNEERVAADDFQLVEVPESHDSFRNFSRVAAIDSVADPSEKSAAKETGIECKLPISSQKPCSIGGNCHNLKLITVLCYLQIADKSPYWNTHLEKVEAVGISRLSPYLMLGEFARHFGWLCLLHRRVWRKRHPAEKPGNPYRSVIVASLWCFYGRFISDIVRNGNRWASPRIRYSAATTCSLHSGICGSDCFLICLIWKFWQCVLKIDLTIMNGTRFVF